VRWHRWCPRSWRPGGRASPSSSFFPWLLLLLTHAGANFREVMRETAAGLPPFARRERLHTKPFLQMREGKLSETVGRVD
jgi:hypothetical protein